VFTVEDRGRVLVFAAGSASGGIPSQWAATEDLPETVGNEGRKATTSTGRSFRWIQKKRNSKDTD
jgi:hypothetical protein